MVLYYNNCTKEVKIREGQKVPVGATITLIVGKNDAGEPTAIPNLYGSNNF
jgi:pyruvate/2-oxoglutarate dehydrogenase complex dihydrolipoamide acyltransferase (E2) component